MDDYTTKLLKRILQRMDLNYISYVGYPADEEVPYPEGFLEGYHQCIEHLVSELTKLGYQLN